MRQRVDITEVERATKIRAKYLRALENEEFDLLPGPTFVRSFLRTYAEYLGLDSRLLIEEFRVSYEPPEEEEAQHFTPRPPKRDDRRYDRRPPGVGWLVAAGIVAVLAIFLVIGLLAGDQGGGGGSGSGTQARTTTTKAGRADRRSRGRAKRSGRKPAARRPTTVSLRIVPAAATYVCVDRGPGQAPLFNGSIAGPRTFKGRRLRLNLGMPSASVRVNGRRVDTGGGANPVGFAFTPGGKPKPLPIGQRPCA